MAMLTMIRAFRPQCGTPQLGVIANVRKNVNDGEVILSYSANNNMASTRNPYLHFGLMIVTNVATIRPKTWIINVA